MIAIAQKIRDLPLGKKAFIAVAVTMAGLSAYRAYQYWITGFFVPDEFGYYADALGGSFYGTRWFFGGANIILFRLFGINSVDRFALFLPFYIFFWSMVTISSIYGILKALDLDERTIALTLVSSLFLVSFVLLSLGFLTEPVGLAMASLGIFCLIAFHKRPDFSKKSGLLLVFSALAFTAATYSREPYGIFLYGGALVVLASSLSKREKLLGKTRLVKVATVALPILLFAVPSAVFINYPPQSSIAGQVSYLTIGFGTNLIAHPPPVTTTATLTLTETVVRNATETTTLTTTVVTNTTQLAGVPGVAFIGSNTLKIFFGGVLLGWGPVFFIVSAIGTVMLLQQTFFKRRWKLLPVLMIAFYALGSYLVVSYIFSGDPNYLTFANYSTIIRFSDTATPAYFLTAPLFLGVVCRTRKGALSMLAVLLIFLLVAVPVYETYASSSISFAQQAPFSLSYRTPAAAVRDFVYSKGQNQSFDIIGVPYGWVFTPGIQDLTSVNVYSTSPSPFYPTLTNAQFIRDRWPTVYIYSGSDNYSVSLLPSYLQQLIRGDSNATAPYYPVSVSQVVRGTGYVLTQLDLGWTG